MKTLAVKLSGLPVAAPMNAATAATLSNVWNALGYPWIRNIIMCTAAAVRQIAGIQVWITTAIIAFVLFNFLRMAAHRKKD